MIIYCATNIVNNKQYVGQTIGILDRRKSVHHSNAKRNVNSYFYKAIRKYGKDSFTWKVIADCPNVETLNEAEKIYISLLNTLAPSGYNLMTSRNNSEHSEETIEKIREANKGKEYSEETIQKMREAQMGKYHKEETIQKMREAHKGKGLSEETIQKISGKNHYMYSKRHKEETIQKLRESQKKRRLREKKKK